MKITDQFAEGMNAEADAIVKRLWATQALMEKRAKEHIDAAGLYDLEYHKAFIKAKLSDEKVSDKVADARARIDTASLKWKADRAESLYKAAISAMHNLRAELDTWRSKSANLKAEAEVIRAGIT